MSGVEDDPCPKRGETRIINGSLCRFIERELEGDKWVVLGPAPTEQADGGVVVTDEWPDTALAKTIYNHFADFEGLAPEEAADSTGALLYSLQMIGVVGSMPEPGNGGRAAATATPPATPIAGGFGPSPDGDTHRVAETAVLANTIRQHLLGIRPDDQAVVLEDDDWQLILESLERQDAPDRPRR